MSHYPQVFLFVASLLSASSLAQWDVSALQTLGQSCVLSATRVDETKLTLVFQDFTSMLPPAAARGVFDESECFVSVRFVIPPFSTATIFTHRVFARVEKNPAAEVSLDVDMHLGDRRFHLRGSLPAGSDFFDEALLYRAFATDAALGCEPEARSVDVQFRWKMRVAAKSDGAQGRITMSGGERWTDSWIETKPCELSATATRGNETLR